MKFLIPLSCLIDAGNRLLWPTQHAILQPQISAAIRDISQPFAEQMTAPVPYAVVTPPSSLLPAMLFAVWISGVGMGVAFWLRNWWRLRATLRTSAPLDLKLPLAVQSSRERLEPSVVGVFRPVVLLPDGIADRLSPAQLDGVLAHELCHAARRDNLTAAVHMAVETIFWFHPATWWIRTKLVDERERACDEEVVRTGREPQVYAESILNVCKYCLGSPVPCAAGVGGGKLRERIEAIIEDRFVDGLGLGKKIMLCAVAALAVLIPAIGQKGSRFSFEVASVKPAPERDYGAMSRPTGMAPAIEGDPAQITFTDVTLDGVISRAYGVRPVDIKAPGWMQDLKYDIHAKVPAGAPKGHILEMLQSLLADRFQLKLHWESHEEPGYTLAVANGGPKLKPQTPDAPRLKRIRSTGRFELRRSAPNSRNMAANSSNGHFELYHFTMEEFAHALSGNLGKPVVDNTRMPGEYDIVYDAAPGSIPGFLKYFPQGQQESEFPTIFAALRQLGLNLTPVPKVSRRRLVVDSALKTPTAN